MEHRVLRRIARRELLALTSVSLGRIAASHLLAETSHAAQVPIHNNLRARQGHFPARAKAVIQLVQNGGPSQMDLFDPKPALAQHAGRPHPDGVEIHQPGNKNVLLPSPVRVRKARRVRDGRFRDAAAPGRNRRQALLRSLNAYRAQQPSRRVEHAAHVQDLPGKAGHGGVDQLRAGHREPEPAGVRGAAGPEGIHDRRQAALGQRIPSGPVSGRRIQHERIAGPPPRTREADAAGSAA